MLAGKLSEAGYHIDRQLPVDIEFEGRRYGSALKIDLFVEKRLIVEIKSSDHLTKLHTQQVLTYLRLTDLPVGLVINFGASSLKDGIRRVVNGHIDSVPSATSA